MRGFRVDELEMRAEGGKGRDEEGERLEGRATKGKRRWGEEK